MSNFMCSAGCGNDVEYAALKAERDSWAVTYRESSDARIKAEAERDEARANACAIATERDGWVAGWKRVANERDEIARKATVLLSASSPGAGWVSPEVVKEVREALELCDCCGGASGPIGVGYRSHYRDCRVVAALAKLPKEET